MTTARTWLHHHFQVPTTDKCHTTHHNSCCSPTLPDFYSTTAVSLYVFIGCGSSKIHAETPEPTWFLHDFQQKPGGQVGCTMLPGGLSEEKHIDEVGAALNFMTTYPDRVHRLTIVWLVNKLADVPSPKVVCCHEMFPASGESHK